MRFLLPITLTFLFAISPAETAEIKPEAGAFAPFWAQFKAAVASKNKEAIAGMTKFPLVCDGEQLAKTDFMKKCDVIFGEKIRKCFQNAKPVKADDRDSYSVFCGETIFVFEKENGKYRFTDLGVND